MRICLKWLIKYYIELGKEIGIVLSKGKWIEIAYLAITTGIGFLVDTKEYIELYTNINLGQIPVPVLNGLLAGTTILVSLFLYTPMRIFRTNREKIALLEEQQKPKLQIGFDLKKFPGCLDDTSNAYEDTQTGKTVRIRFSQKWRIFIYNPSATETIKNVEAKLIDINKCLSGSARNLPAVHLKFTHDNKGEQRSISINPQSREFVDVIECFMSSEQINENIFYIQHTEKNQNYTELSLFFDNIDKEDCKIRIEVGGGCNL